MFALIVVIAWLLWREKEKGVIGLVIYIHSQNHSICLIATRNANMTLNGVKKCVMVDQLYCTRTQKQHSRDLLVAQYWTIYTDRKSSGGLHWPQCITQDSLLLWYGLTKEMSNSTFQTKSLVKCKVATCTTHTCTYYCNMLCIGNASYRSYTFNSPLYKTLDIAFHCQLWYSYEFCHNAAGYVKT